MVQGEHIGVVTKYLITRGIRKLWIEVTNRAKVKKIRTGKHRADVDA
jgi:hypothetical protein